MLFEEFIMKSFDPMSHLRSEGLANAMDQISKSNAEKHYAITGNFANEFHKKLIKWINSYHQSLDDEYEAGGQLTNFGSTINFHFTDISYSNPSLISFSGLLEDGSPVELIQHVSQISVLLIKKKRVNPEEPKRPIGFASWPEYQKFIDDK